MLIEKKEEWRGKERNFFRLEKGHFPKSFSSKCSFPFGATQVSKMRREGRKLFGGKNLSLGQSGGERWGENWESHFSIPNSALFGDDGQGREGKGRKEAGIEFPLPLPSSSLSCMREIRRIFWQRLLGMNWENRKEEGWKLSLRPLSSFSIPLLLLLPARASPWLYPKPGGGGP